MKRPKKRLKRVWLWCRSGKIPLSQMYAVAIDVPPSAETMYPAKGFKYKCGWVEFVEVTPKK